MTKKHTNTIKAEAKAEGYNLIKGENGKWFATKVDNADWMSPEFDNPQAALDGAREMDKRGTGTVVPLSYKEKYKRNGDPTSCGDDVANAFKEFVTVGKQMSLTALRQVANENGLDAKLDEYEDKGLNNGMRRMNIGNMLRAKAKRGEPVVIGTTWWNKVGPVAAE